MTEPADTGRRELLTAGLVVAAAGIASPAATQNSPEMPARPRGISVRDFGAVGDGVTDDTAAFNRATRAGEQWSAALGLLIVVPPGTYRLDGSVYVRKGQHLQGSGEPTLIDAKRARGRTFVLGSGLNEGAPRPDPGGAPVQISELRTVGGAATEAVVFTDAQGFAIRRLFLSSPGVGLHVAGADGMIEDIVIDQGLNGLLFERCQNIIVDKLISYAVNYAVTFGTGACDVIVTAAHLCYSRNAAILLAEMATGIANVRIRAANFIMNEQFKSFIGYVHCRASGAELTLNDCSFRNWPGFAIQQAAGRGAQLNFARCQFDGEPTNKSYNGTDSSRVVATGAAGRFRFTDCNFSHLHGEIALVRQELAELSLTGGSVENCPLPPVRVVADKTRSAIKVRDVAGFATGGDGAIVLPDLPGAQWEVTVRLTGLAEPWRATITADGSDVTVSPAPPPLRVRTFRRNGSIGVETSGAAITAVDVRTGL